jgi:DNA polymerase V
MTPPDHGGYRPGAGRKSGSGGFGEPTQPVRVPISQMSTVVAFLDACRNPAIATDPQRIAIDTKPIGLTAFAHSVPGGFPSPADDYLDREFNLNEQLIIKGHESSTYILRCGGFSMAPTINDGDRVVVDRALTAVSDDIVIAILNFDLTIKRLGSVGTGSEWKLALLPDNPRFKPIVMEPGDTLEIWGVVTNCLRSFRRGRR